MKTVQEIPEYVAGLITKAVRETFQIELSEDDVKLEIPPKENWGEFAFPCFVLAKEAKKDPKDIAESLYVWFREHPDSFIEETETKGPYLNFHLARKEFSSVVLHQIMREKSKYGSAILGKDMRAMVEFSSPNTNKPLHIGHLRNNSLGYSMSTIMEKIGYEAVRLLLINDRGIHIMKSMLAYMKWGNGETPESTGMKSDHFVGKYYVMFAKQLKKEYTEKVFGSKSNNPEAEKIAQTLKKNEARKMSLEVERELPLMQEAQELLRKWEQGDEETVKLWKQMNEWAIQGLDETYEMTDVHFDDRVLESEIYQEGRRLVEEGLQKGIFYKTDDGRVKANLDDKKLPEATVLRADGTTLYTTQDLYLAEHKFERWHLDKSIYVVGSEQDLHLAQVFAICEKLGKPFATPEKLIHMSYGMVRLADGKMKSREGKVVDADDLVNESMKLAKKATENSETSSKNNIDETGRIVGLGAIKFYMLRNNAKTDIVYDAKDALSFDGYTGPFIQYSYARAKSVMRKSKTKVDPKASVLSLKEDKAFNLTKKLSYYPDKVLEAARTYDPSVIAAYLFDLARAFNSFYHALPILKTEKKIAEGRLLLTAATAEVLKDGLFLLGIEAPEEM